MTTRLSSWENVEMAKIERFEDLQSWQKGRQLANQIYDLTSHTNFSKDFRLRDQINDAAGSVMHNITEGFDAGSNLEFIRFSKCRGVLPARYSQNLIWHLTANI
jgi:23S rRNA-intervening sequence protein